jgi:hypothetical protein|tara:strand:- start:146 stop:319 length:174 start_codon:yes stop_codon:yes gene_type:complete
MARNDGVRYGAGGVLMEIMDSPDPAPAPEKKKKKAQVLEERIHDNLPSDVEPHGEDS